MVIAISPFLQGYGIATAATTCTSLPLPPPSVPSSALGTWIFFFFFSNNGPHFMGQGANMGLLPFLNMSGPALHSGMGKITTRLIHNLAAH